MGLRLPFVLVAWISLAGCSTFSKREPPATPPAEAKLTSESLQAVIPIGTPIADARTFLEKFGFHSTEDLRQVRYGPNNIEIVTFERTDKQGWVSHTWHVALRLREGKVIDVRATNYLTGT